MEKYMSFDVLSRDTKIEDNLLFEASAGTGKTYTIEHLTIRRLLAYPKASMHEFAVLTFTKAVAKELACRIGKAIDAAILDLRSENEEAPDYLKPYFGTDALGRLVRARGELELASIDTFHGFCYRLLADGKEASFATGQDITFLIEEFLKEKVDDFAYELKILLDHFHKDISKLIGAISARLWKDHDVPRAVKVSGEYSEDALLAATYGYNKLRSRDGTLKPEIEKVIYAFTRFIEHDDHAAIMRYPLYASKVFSDPKKGVLPNEAVLFAKSQEPIIRELSHPERILSRLSARCRAFVSSELRRKKLMAVEELLSLMEQAIQDESFREKVRMRFSCVIVDEFQDTDPLQWKILELVFLNDWKGALYLVGDPKQAIYAFRDADVYCYMQARNHKRQNVVTLSKNFRSSKRLVEGLNSLFYREKLFELPKNGLFLEVPQIIPGRTLEEIADGKDAINLFIAKAELGKKKNWPTCEVENEFFFPYIAEEIMRLQLPFQTIAILVKDRYQAGRLERYLQSRNIPTCSWRKKSIVESEAHLFLERLLLSLESVRDKKRLTNLLMQKPFSCPCLDDLESWAEHATHLLMLKNALDDRGLAACIRLFLDSVWPGFTVSMKEYLWEEQDFLFDLDYLVELSDYLPVLKRLPQSERDHLTSRFEPEEAGVQILTMHASKGLEFDVVFALAVASRNQVDDDADALELDAEKLRQFYVACTRACRRLYLPVAEQLDYTEVATGRKAPMELFLEKCPLHEIKATSTLLEQNLATSPLCTIAKEKHAPLFLEPLSYRANRIKITSFSQEREERLPFQSKKIEEKLPTGAFAGVILHELLEEMRLFSREELTNRLGLTPFEGMEEEVEQLIARALSVQLGSFSLQDVAKDKMRSELEFFIKDPTGPFIHGIIDLFFEHDGRCYIIDWKSNALESYSQDALTKEVLAKGYDLQAKIYKEACIQNNYTFGGFYFVFLRGLKEGGVLLYE